MWVGDGIVKALGCAKKGKGSNLILDMSWSWHHHDDWIQQTINIEPQKRKHDDNDLSWVWWTINN